MLLMATLMLKKWAVNNALHVHINAEKWGSVTENNVPHVHVYTKNEGGWEGVS